MPVLYCQPYSLEYDMKSRNVNFLSLFYRLENYLSGTSMAKISIKTNCSGVYGLVL